MRPAYLCAIAAASTLTLACDDDGSTDGEGGSGAADTTSSAPNGPATSGTQSTGTQSTGSQSTGTDATTTGTGGGPPGTITIVGSGFGTKASPGPILYDDFEAGALGSKIESQPAVVGSWESGAGSTVPEYSDVTVRTGARASRHAFNPTDYNASLAKNVALTTLYLDYWTFVEPLDDSPSGFSRNWKPYRFYGADDALQSGITSLSGNASAITYFTDLDNGNDVGEWTDGYPVGTWFHIQTWIRVNDVGQANGTLGVRVDAEVSGVENAELRGQDAPLDQLRIGHYWATDPVPEWPYENSGANVYVDDVYLDSTWQRVEVGDADTYEAVQHREIQLVTAWSDTEVTFELSKGTLPSGPAWAFVIGEDGSVLATQAITLP